jgi:hypothetical protein
MGDWEFPGAVPRLGFRLGYLLPHLAHFTEQMEGGQGGPPTVSPTWRFLILEPGIPIPRHAGMGCPLAPPKGRPCRMALPGDTLDWEEPLPPVTLNWAFGACFVTLLKCV